MHSICRLTHEKDAICLLAIAAFACLIAFDVVASGREALAPNGTLRVGLNLGNAVTVTRDPATGELQGVAADLGRALASDLRVKFEPVTYPSAERMAEAVRAGEWDVAFLAADPARAVDMEFTEPYMLVDNTYLVPQDTPHQTVATMDQAGVRIAVVQRSAPDLFLTRTLRNAEIIRSSAGLAGAAELVRTGQADALAADRYSLLGVAAKWPRARVFEEPFLSVEHAIAVPTARKTGMSYLHEFLKQAKRSGLIQQFIERSGIKGVRAAP